MDTKQYVIVIDLDRCIGCKGGCQAACKIENKTALGESRSKLYCMGPTGTYPDLEMYFMPVMCQQCDQPTCASVCPTGACYKRAEDGVILIDKDRCVGCQSCKRACPYDVPIFNKEMSVSDKCDVCAPLREEGEKPVCVKNCSGKAILYGDILDPESDVSVALREAGEENVYSLEDMDNRPRGRFILRNATWVSTLPQIYGKRMKEKYQWRKE
ncbi:MAG: 4Fe-4S dicluster domain-containing protein [Anaerovoracaceae bacterium]|jgi:Fe-S-cluster-containing dehydrogenase component